MGIGTTVLEAIGNTALVQLRRVVPAGCARILREGREGRTRPAA